MRTLSYLGIFVTVVGSSVAACSSDAEPPTGPAAGGGAALTATTFCEMYAQATCAATEACDCPTLDGAKDCVTKNVDKCESTLAGLLGAISLGDVQFDAAAASACIEDAAKTLGTCVVPTSRNAPEACRFYLNDSAKLGESCSKFGAGLRCAGGAGVCDGMTGACIAPGAKDEPCVAAVCADSLVCDAGMCRSLQPKGGACTRDEVCEGGLQCLDGACAPPRATGEPCASSTSCAAGLGCIAGECATAFPAGEGCELEECGAESTCLAIPD